MSGILVRSDENTEATEYNNLKSQILATGNNLTTQINRVIAIEAGWSGDDVVTVDAFRTQVKGNLEVLADAADPLT